MQTLTTSLQKKYHFLTPEDIAQFLALGSYRNLDPFDFYIKLDTEHRYFGIITKGLVRGL